MSTSATLAEGPPVLRTLIVDNYDSYTFNLLQLFTEDQLENVVVIHNDRFAWPDFQEHVLPHFDQVILSPGPGRPERAQDFGICTQILQTSHIPVFGVCLGHQGIGWIHGAKITYGPEPVHGQIAQIKHDGTGLFKGIPQDFDVVRYHSLVIQEHDLPADLVATAWCYSFPLITADSRYGHGLGQRRGAATNSRASTFFEGQLGAKSIMGIRHRTLPHHGVQFHPESISSYYGKEIMSNFFRISTEFYRTHHPKRSIVGVQRLPEAIRALSIFPARPNLHSKASSLLTTSFRKTSPNPYTLLIHALDASVFPEPETVFSSLFLTGPRCKAASWWLDSARQPHPMARFSFMGGVKTRRCHGQQQSQQLVPGAAQAVIQYSTLHKEIQVRRYSTAESDRSDIKRIQLKEGTMVTTFWDWMSSTMAALGKDSVETVVVGSHGEERELDEVPFDFFAGMVGYFGYEMKRESLEGYTTPKEQRCSCTGHNGDDNKQDQKTSKCCTCDCLRQPDAAFMLATQAVVFDHVERRVYVLGLVNNYPGQTLDNIEVPVGFISREVCQSWIQDVTQSILHLSTQSVGPIMSRKSVVTAASLAVALNNGEPPLLKTQQQQHQQQHQQQQQWRRRQSLVGLVAPFEVDVTEQEYLKAIQDSLDYIHEGESYELCMTTQFRAQLPLYQRQSSGDGQPVDGEDSDPAYDLYRILRKLNPAPFSAFLSIPTALQRQGKDQIVGKLIILSSSPERFLKIGPTAPHDMTDDVKDALLLSSRTVEMKPIKGTVAVAKGCFCKEDEGCGVDGHSGDSSEHPEDEDDETSDRETDDERDMAVFLRRNAAERERRRSVIDRCAEARKREDQSRIELLSKNIKERAENLMIVDLIRNDLAHVCRSKSVRVPSLMHVESYETVHQLVTTVRGELMEHVDNIQAIRACFPPGSMTGAPKLRSVQLLDSLEGHVKRGIYSGCLGYIGIPASGARARKKVRSAVDFSVVIRTAVLSVEASKEEDASSALIADLSVGAGGALTILSDANEEWREVLLKSRSVVPSVLTYLHQNA
ncbi:Protein phosphatase PP2A regulatory subunit B [Mortierella claussenii]|nr:Protein phosphatase PP2A regulatory subunit B [Mortierella claussenii]